MIESDSIKTFLKCSVKVHEIKLSFNSNSNAASEKKRSLYLTLKICNNMSLMTSKPTSLHRVHSLHSLKASRHFLIFAVKYYQCFNETRNPINLVKNFLCMWLIRKEINLLSDAFFDVLQRFLDMVTPLETVVFPCSAFTGSL